MRGKGDLRIAASRPRQRSPRAFFGTACAVGALILPASASAGTIIVSPSQDLNPAGQTVSVQLSGFAGHAVWIDVGQDTPSGSYCNFVSYAYDGSFAPSTLYITGFLSNFSPPSGLPPDHARTRGRPITRRETSVRTQKTCSVQVRDGSSGDVLASTPISFAFPPPVCQDRKLVVTVKPDRPSAQALNVNCSDASDRSLDFSVVSGPTHGTFRFTGQGQSVYTATPGYVGPDSVTFEASAGDQDSNVATVSIDVVKPPPVPPPPVRYAFEYNCMRGLAGGLRRGRVFDYVFKPDGGRGTRTPSDFSTASFIRNYFMEPTRRGRTSRPAPASPSRGGSPTPIRAHGPCRARAPGASWLAHRSTSRPGSGSASATGS
jgi:Bacterial Ig domain